MQTLEAEVDIVGPALQEVLLGDLVSAQPWNPIFTAKTLEVCVEIERLDYPHGLETYRHLGTPWMPAVIRRLENAPTSYMTVV
ncbi:hypothetical protein EYF80_042687 [Liparis tanakae]|uniref:Uncharacterized protein n=1 Tax=Liparis tanakae TaxID=230148 RepID=A0A4Z2G1H0_9TELE|nr:hypothetical protein EYF80_042687 [Liparis tanakae]